MMTRNKILFASFLSLMAIFSYSCKKQNTSIDYNPAITASKEFVANQQMMTLILNTYFKSLNDSTLWADDFAIVDGAGVRIKYSPELMMEIQYETWGNYDGYGHFRMGAIEAIPETDFVQPDALVNFDFIDFLYDKDTLNVDKMTVRYLANGDPTIQKFEVKVDSAIIIYSDTSGQNSFNLYQTFRLKKNPSTPYISPLDELFITGTMEGIAMDLSTYSVLVPDSTEIIERFDCVWLKNGPSQVQVDGFEFPADAYFPAPDSCKNEYVIEIDGNPFPFPFDYNY